MSHWCCASHATSHCNVPRAAPTLPGCFNHLPLNVTLVLRLPRNVNHLPPHVTLVLRLPRNVTLQRTIPCTSHPRATLQLEVSRVQAIQFHVYKRANFMCTSEPAPVLNAVWKLCGCMQSRPERRCLWIHTKYMEKYYSDYISVPIVWKQFCPQPAAFCHVQSKQQKRPEF